MNPHPCDGDIDTRLIAAARAGSDAAFERIVARHQKAVRGFLRRLGGDPSDADDLAQDTFVTAWTQLDRFRGQASVRSWLCGIAYRSALVGAGRGCVAPRATWRSPRRANPGRATSTPATGWTWLGRWLACRSNSAPLSACVWRRIFLMPKPRRP